MILSHRGCRPPTRASSSRHDREHHRRSICERARGATYERCSSDETPSGFNHIARAAGRLQMETAIWQFCEIPSGACERAREDRKVASITLTSTAHFPRSVETCCICARGMVSVQRRERVHLDCCDQMLCVACLKATSQRRRGAHQDLTSAQLRGNGRAPQGNLATTTWRTSGSGCDLCTTERKRSRTSRRPRNDDVAHIRI